MQFKRTLQFTFLLFVTFSAVSGFIPAFALSPDSQQHFDAGSVSHWAVTVSSGGNIASILNQTGQSGPSADSRDVSPSTNGLVFTSSDCGACAMTVTYADPTPQPVSNQRFVMVDINTNAAVQVNITVTTTSGSATATTNNMVNCAAPNVFVGSTTAGTWYMVFVDLSQPPFSSLTGNLLSVTLTIPDGSASGGGAGVFIDNLV